MYWIIRNFYNSLQLHKSFHRLFEQIIVFVLLVTGLVLQHLTQVLFFVSLTYSGDGVKSINVFVILLGRVFVFLHNTNSGQLPDFGVSIPNIT